MSSFLQHFRGRGWNYVIALVIAIFAGSLGAPALANIFYVTSAGDTCPTAPPGTLRWAIESANANLGPDDIRFDGLGDTVKVQCDLPALTDPGTVIMGETSSTGMIIDNPAGLATAGLRVATDDCDIRGLTIRRFENGIVIEPPLGNSAMRNTIGGPLSSHQNSITENWSGVYLTGVGCDSNAVINNRIFANDAYGVRLVDGPCTNFIGRALANQRNAMNNNGYYGIYLAGADEDVHGNEIIGNAVGTNFSGISALGNGWDGIHLTGVACAHNLVHGNHVCDNAMTGIALEGGAWENTVTTNIVGVDATGGGALGNHAHGISMVEGVHHNHIGPDNHVSGNDLSGVTAIGTSTYANEIFSNNIGLNSTATAALQNAAHGVHINGAMDCEVRENTISGNGMSGIEIEGGSIPPHTIIGNRIGTDSDGLLAMANGQHGLHIIQCAYTEIRDNVISGNTQVGIFLEESCDYTQVTGNLIGTGPNGVVPIRNQKGMVIRSSANMIGGIVAGEGNVISHNYTEGIRMRNTNSAQIDNRIEGNRIASNGADGVYLGNGMVKNFVGNETIGLPPEAGNVIHGNGGYGIRCAESGAAIPPEENRFMSNSITQNVAGGIDILSTTPPGNAGIPAPTIIYACDAGAIGVTNLGGNDTVVQIFADAGTQGETMLGEVEVIGTGNWIFNGAIPVGMNVTATNTGHYPLASDPIHTSEFSAPMVAAADVEREPQAQTAFSVAPAAPNPFGHSTSIGFEIPQACRVSIEVFDASGRRIRMLLDEVVAVGTHAVSWDARDGAGRPVAPGVYFYRVARPGDTEVRRLVLHH